MNALIIIAVLGFGIAFYGQIQSNDKKEKDDKITEKSR